MSKISYKFAGKNAEKMRKSAAHSMTVIYARFFGQKWGQKLTENLPEKNSFGAPKQALHMSAES